MNRVICFKIVTIYDRTDPFDIGFIKPDDTCLRPKPSQRWTPKTYLFQISSETLNSCYSKRALFAKKIIISRSPFRFVVAQRVLHITPGVLLNAYWRCAATRTSKLRRKNRLVEKWMSVKLVLESLLTLKIVWLCIRLREENEGASFLIFSGCSLDPSVGGMKGRGLSNDVFCRYDDLSSRFKDSRWCSDANRFDTQLHTPLEIVPRHGHRARVWRLRILVFYTRDIIIVVYNNNNPEVVGQVGIQGDQRDGTSHRRSYPCVDDFFVQNNVRLELIVYDRRVIHRANCCFPSSVNVRFGEVLCKVFTTSPIAYTNKRRKIFFTFFK